MLTRLIGCSSILAMVVERVSRHTAGVCAFANVARHTHYVIQPLRFYISTTGAFNIYYSIADESNSSKLCISVKKNRETQWGKLKKITNHIPTLARPLSPPLQ